MGNCIGCDTTASTGAHERLGGDDSFVEALFFPDGKFPCKAALNNELCERKACRFSHEETSLLKVLKYLQSAKRTMDIAVFTITCDEISNEVLAAHKRGVRVRVITDDGQSKGKGSDIQKFVDAGIPVRDDNAGTYMHHKFCIIDKKLLMNGSFNWSRQAVTGNAENLVIHSGGPIIRRFSEYYEELWAKYADNQRKK